MYNLFVMHEQLAETKTFENQFDHQLTLETQGGTARYVYVEPEELASPDALPVLVSGGWSVGIKSLRDAAKVLHDYGYSAILVEHEPSTLSGKADTILRVLDELEIPKVNAITQSEGAITTAMAALRAPERFKTLILEAPAGLSGKDSTGRLIGRFALKTGMVATYDFARNPGAVYNFMSSSSQYIARSPRRSLREVKAIAGTSINETLAKVREAGVKVGVVQSRADRGFSHKKIYEQLVYENGDDLGLHVDAYASIANRRAGHDHIILNAPQAIKCALQLIGNLEEK